MVLGKAEVQVGRFVGRLIDRGYARRGGPRSVASVKKAGESLAIDPGHRLLSAARQLLGSVKDNAYAHTPNIAPEKGLFHGDCSDLINHLLGKVDPKALLAVPVDAATLAPRSRTYFSFLKDLPLVGSNGAKKWARVGRPAELRAGDLIAWKNAAYQPGKGSTGHMMLVSGEPVAVRRNGKLTGFDVSVVDSTSHGHGLADLRAKAGPNGLGQGVVYFPIDEKGFASGFSWAPSTEAAGGTVRPPDLAFGRLQP